MNPSPNSRRPVPSAGDALLLIDVQRDFLPGGSLAVADGDAIVPVLNHWIARFAAAGLPVIATRDWHPPDHCSFAAQGGDWPAHCVAGSAGAEFAAALRLPAQVEVVSKAGTAGRDAYSGFDGTDLAARLHAHHVTRLLVGGLATDYCVQATVLDARAVDFEVIVLRDGIAAVNAKPGDGLRALSRISAAGARLADSDELQPAHAAH